MRSQHLTISDLQSSAWANIKADIESDLADARRLVETDLDELKTAKLRGRIAALKDLLGRESALTKGPQQGDDSPVDED